jgi:cell division transport system ATP-binding protein
MIRFNNVFKTYPTGKVLENISFHIPAGEFVIITGPSGAGKTTLARLMIKDINPSSGEIFIDGENLSQLKSRHIHTLRKKISVIFQDYKIIPDKTVIENIILPLEVIGFSSKEQLDKAKNLLSLVGIQDKQDLFPVQLSGGELQRAAIARAIAVEPDILFADEPTGNLDSDTAKQIIALFKKINQTGTTVLVATHTPEFVSIGDRHIHLEKAKITQDTAKTKSKKSKIKTKNKNKNK